MNDSASSSPALRDLRALPKAHLHIHLDGAYPLVAVEALARRRGVAFSVPPAFADVGSFFESYGTVPPLVETADDLAFLCRALVHAEAAEGVLYLEPAFEPQLYAPRLGSLDEVTRVVLGAFRDAAQETGIEVGALLTINTDENHAIADDLARVAASHAGRGVTGLGTAGFVEPGNLRRYRGAAAIARAAGLPVVSHAGQVGGADSVREALEELGASRIAHGFRAIECSDLVHRLAGEGIACDMCPVSNCRLGFVRGLDAHPAPTLMAAGVPVTLNADDPLWFSAGVTEQYRIAREVWGLGDPAIAAFARAGAGASGISDGTRRRLLAGIDNWLAVPTSPGRKSGHAGVSVQGFAGETE